MHALLAIIEVTTLGQSYLDGTFMGDIDLYPRTYESLVQAIESIVQTVLRDVGACAILLETWNLCFASILFVYMLIQFESDSELVFSLVREIRGLGSRVCPHHNFYVGCC